MKKLITCFFLFSIQLSAGIGVGESPTAPLPVELTSFTANLSGSNVELRWVTATEVRNYGFEVERASSSTTPIQEWVKISFIEGHGNSNSPQEYSFTDIPQGGTKFQYRLKQIDTDGKYAYSEVANIDMGIPSQYELKQNYPNPFNPGTVISYSIPISSNVTLRVYDVLGKLITTLVNENQEAGNYTVYFDAGGLSNGMYFYKVQVYPANSGTGNFVATKKMLLLK